MGGESDGRQVIPEECSWWHPVEDIYQHMDADSGPIWWDREGVAEGVGRDGDGSIENCLWL